MLTDITAAPFEKAKVKDDAGHVVDPLLRLRLERKQKNIAKKKKWVRLSTRPGKEEV
jgi:hypothetical protein